MLSVTRCCVKRTPEVPVPPPTRFAHSLRSLAPPLPLRPQTPTGQMNGNFLGIGADLSINASVQVDTSQAAGILITNGEFTAFHTPDWLPNSKVESSQVVVGKENKGPVKFVDSSFWGPSSQIALLEGQGTVTFASCEFVEWDEQKKDGRAAIQASNGSLILNGNSFAQNKKQVSLGKGVKKAIITANIVTGAKNMDIDAAVKAQVGSTRLTCKDRSNAAVRRHCCIRYLQSTGSSPRWQRRSITLPARAWQTRRLERVNATQSLCRTGL